MLKSLDNWEILDDELVDKIVTSPEEERHQWLFLGTDDDYPGQWTVNCLEPAFFFDFEDLIGPYRIVGPNTLPKLFDRANSLDYRVAFESDPSELFRRIRSLNDPPEFSLNSILEGTDENGFFPWQLQGFNKLKDQSGKAIWDTGTGKTALAAALIRYHRPTTQLTFYLAKANNKINTQRKLAQLADVDSIVLDASTLDKRAALYADIFRKLEAGEHLVLITNYEKFRDDEEALKILCTNRDCLFVWDEMPTRLSNRGTKLYEAVVRCIWRTGKDKPDDVPNPLRSRFRVKSYRAYELSATPIENDPEGDYNCTRLIDPFIFGSVDEFRSEYVATWDFFNPRKPDGWHKLDKFEKKQAHIVHRVNKSDPDIAQFFPAVVEDTIYIDWSDKDRRAYDKLEAIAKKKAELFKEGAEEKKFNPLALIGVLQMLCDAPSMLNRSALNRAEWESAWEEWAETGEGNEPARQGSEIAIELIAQTGPLEDGTHTKLEELRSLLLDKHPDDAVAIFSVYNEMLLPILSQKLDEWGVKHVVYTGTDKQKQRAFDRFTTDPEIRVFLSPDSGSDSIDLERASVVIDYDLPWKWTTRTQRRNRAHRATSTHSTVYFYSLIMANSVEERREEIVEEKGDYHAAIYDGAASEIDRTARYSRDDFMYVLTGER